MKKAVTILVGFLGISVLAFIILLIMYVGKADNIQNDNEETTSRKSVIFYEIPKDIELPDWAETFENCIEENLLTVNPYSRPGKELKEVKGIVIHYVGNPGTTAAQNRSYFEGLKDSKITEASSHFIVGLDGEIISCVPTDEIAYASNDRNSDTIAIECCHPDETGKFNTTTYDSLIKLSAYLCIIYDLDPVKDIIRHYDITGKECPAYFVKNENEWNLFKSQVKTQMQEK